MTSSLFSPLLFIGGLYLLTYFASFPGLSLAQAASAAVVAPPLVWLSVVDIRHQRIPDTASATVAIVGLVHLGRTEPHTIWLQLAAATLILALFWIAGEIYFRKSGHEGLGIGDAKLLAAGALNIGIDQFWLLLLLASVGGIVAALAPWARARVRPDAIPFGPFIAYSLFLCITILGR